MDSKTLILEFAGLCMIRQPTDPDPYDELRGVSGYTFAFGNEPDLNRVLYFQPDSAYPVRSHCPEIGVRVTRACIQRFGGNRDISALTGATFDLLGNPKLENRNWNLTRPGYEPIVPFHIKVTAPDDALVLQRLDVLDPAHADTPVWKLPLEAIEKKGARGLSYEPATVGLATGAFDGYLVAKERRAALQKDLDARHASGCGDDPEVVVLQGRISELDIGIAAAEKGAPNRRTAVRPMVERFGYFMSGKPAELSGDPTILQGQIELGAESRWRVDFWIGGWDCDALCAHTQGAIQIPYATDQT